MKTCSKCGKTKSPANFSEGHSRCASCRAEQQLRYQKREPEKHAARARAYRKTDSHARDRPAQKVVECAKKKGELKVPTACASCGRSGKGLRLEAHHPDHDKPKSVVFLCSSCHRRTKG